MIEYFNITSIINTDINITRTNQNPADISSTNLFTTQGFRTTYFINSTLNSIATVNISSIKQCYIVNNTLGEKIIFTNGTTDGNLTCIPYSANNSIERLYNWTIGDNNIYPATYNIDEGIMETTTHTKNDLPGVNNMVKIELLNVSNTKKYNFLELMINCSGGALQPETTFYCNSSYTTGNPATNANCATIGSMNCIGTYNHTHRIVTTPYSSHQIYTFAINTTTHSFNNVYVTPTSYFITRGNGAATWSWYSIAIQSRLTSTALSSNSGTSWTNQAGLTADGHLHQFTGNESLWYYVTLYNQTVGTYQSTTIQDLIDLAGLAPSAPSVTNPVGIIYSKNTVIPIQFTQSISPNDYPVNFYNISLYNVSFNYLSTLNTQATNADYNWDTTLVTPGIYTIGVYANDSQNQISLTGFSSNFTISNNPTINGCSIDRYIVLGDSKSILTTVTQGTLSLDKVWFNLDGQPYSIQNANNGLNTLTFNSAIFGLGDYIITCQVNDTNNIRPTSASNTTTVYTQLVVTNGVVNNSNPVKPGSIIQYSETISGGLNLNLAYLKVNDVTDAASIITATTGVNNLQFTTQNYGTYTLVGCANDTVEEVCTTPQTITFYQLLSTQGTPYIQTVNDGRIPAALRDVMTDRLGSYFWILLAGILFVGVWIRTRGN